MKKSPDERMKEIYEAQAGEIRKNISIAAAEIERLRANRKLTSKNKKNGAKLLKDCVMRIRIIFSLSVMQFQTFLELSYNL